MQKVWRLCCGARLVALTFPHPLPLAVWERKGERGVQERKHIDNLPCSGCTGAVRTRGEIRVFDQALGDVTQRGLKRLLEKKCLDTRSVIGAKIVRTEDIQVRSE